MDENVESTGEVAVQGQPSPKISPTPAVPPSVVDAGLEAAFRRIAREEAERASKSIHDKRIAKQETKLNDVESQLARVKELMQEGLSEKMALQFMKVEELVGQNVLQPSSPSLSQAAQGSAPQTADDYLTPFLAATGLDANSAEVLDVLYRVSDPLAQVKELSNLAAKKRQAPLAPNPAAVLPTGGGAPVDAGDDLNALTAKLTLLQKEPLKNIQEIKRVSEQMRQKLGMK